MSGRIDPTAPGRQQVYLDALRTVPEISIHLGSFLLSEKFAGLVKPPEFRPRTVLAQPWPDVVKVVKVEEKGSDVNLASHLLLDAFQGNFDVAAVLSNDSDLVEPIRIVTKVLGKPVGLLSPVSTAPKLEHRWIAPRRTIIDLLPAGAELRRSGSITWPASQFKMSLAGFEHVFAHAVEVHLPGGMTIRVAPPIVTALPKIIAWVDDPYGAPRTSRIFESFCAGMNRRVAACSPTPSSMRNCRISNSPTHFSSALMSARW